MDLNYDYDDTYDLEYEMYSEYPNKVFQCGKHLKYYDEELYISILKEVIEIVNDLRKINIYDIKAYRDEIDAIIQNNFEVVYFDDGSTKEFCNFSVSTYEDLLNLQTSLNKLLDHHINLTNIKKEIQNILTQ